MGVRWGIKQMESAMSTDTRPIRYLIRAEYIVDSWSFTDAFNDLAEARRAFEELKTTDRRAWALYRLSIGEA